VLEAVANDCRALGAKEVHVIAADLADQAAVTSTIEQAIEKLGGLDILILNHIIGYFNKWNSPQGHLNNKDLAEIFSVNTLSYINAATAALPALEQSKGAITVVSSAAAKMGMPMVAPYSATKHALRKLSIDNGLLSTIDFWLC
jgi:corticosteroid 11-beta-dehydrogenase isozyme 1